jgi:predicted nucleic acid-binding protein
MAVYFFDSSALVKRYVAEIGTPWVQSIFAAAPANVVYLARMALVEVTSAVARRQRAGTVSLADATTFLTQFRQDTAMEYRIIEITAPLLSAAALIAESHALRAYDAVQLAAASELHAQRTANGLSALTLISADHELNDAAKLLGLLVQDPNLHP